MEAPLVIRVAVIGSTGQLGTDLVKRFERTGAYTVAALSHADIECADPESVGRELRRLHPDVVVNTAAYVRVDESEDHPEDAFRVNAYGALHIARTCADLDALCVYVSTDYVFGGEKDEPYTEDDVPFPINVYGVSKLAGEYLTRQASNRWLIVRLAGLFGKSGARGKGGNFVEAVLDKARGGEALRVVGDVHMSPTYTVDAAVAMERLVHSRAMGVYHVTNEGACTWYEFARCVLELAGIDGGIEPITSAQYSAKARRPRNSSLSLRKLSADLEERPRRWEDALRAYLAERGHIAR